ncbi:MAG: hypothetical protein ACJ75F_12615 [Flavisolibacter sp.]|jgi:hypothetical protein
MNRDMQTPHGPHSRKPGDPTYASQPDVTPRKIGGDDSLENSSPNDSHSDEKVIVNEQRGNKTVNAPSQTAANTSESAGSDEDILD